MSSQTKILIIRFSSIGDIVLTSPIIRCLKKQLEGNVVLHYLTKMEYEGLVQYSPHLSKVFTIKKSTNEIMNVLKEEQYDYIIDLHNNLRSNGVIRRLKRLSFSFDKLNYQKWLLTHFKINKLPNKHLVDRYFEGLKALGITNDQKGLDFFIPNNEVINTTEFPSSHQKGYIAFAIGAQHATKRLPMDKIISICKKINQPIILLGDQQDAKRGKKIVEASGNWVVNACGNYSIHQSASIIQQSNTLITHDTGLMHIGSALGVKIISIWGNTIPAFGMYPYYPEKSKNHHIIENKNLKCRPCSKIGYDQCPKKHFKCMNDINEDKVLKALSDL